MGALSEGNISGAFGAISSDSGAKEGTQGTNVTPSETAEYVRQMKTDESDLPRKSFEAKYGGRYKTVSGYVGNIYGNTIYLTETPKGSKILISIKDVPDSVIENIRKTQKISIVVRHPKQRYEITSGSSFVRLVDTGVVAKDVPIKESRSQLCKAYAESKLTAERTFIGRPMALTGYVLNISNNNVALSDTPNGKKTMTSISDVPDSVIESLKPKQKFSAQTILTQFGWDSCDPLRARFVK